MSEEYEKMSASEKKKEDWMNSKWRPMMGWLYMIVCAFDFVIFPIMYAAMTAIMFKGQLPAGFPTQWQPLTLQGAGLFHIAMGAVLGIAALGRTQEKLAGANNGGIQTTSQGISTTSSTPQSGFGAPAGGFGSTTPSSFGSSSGFGAPTSGPVNPAPSWGTTPIASSPGQVTTGFGGKPAPIQPPQPLI
jgi:hypothetical protein